MTDAPALATLPKRLLALRDEARGLGLTLTADRIEDALEHMAYELPGIMADRLLGRDDAESQD